jgi:NAD-dependent dihydropyrimidine dehydrogenase PreA subunit
MKKINFAAVCKNLGTENYASTSTMYYYYIPHILPDRVVYYNHSSMLCESCVYRCSSQVIMINI